MDFDDDSAAPVAKPASKFQPKAKPRPRSLPKKDSSSTVKATVVSVKSSNPEFVTSQSNELDDANHSHVAVANTATPMETSSVNDALNSQTSLSSYEPLVAADKSKSKSQSQSHIGLLSSEVVGAMDGPDLGFARELSATAFCSKDFSPKSGPDGDNTCQSRNIENSNQDTLGSLCTKDMEDIPICYSTTATNHIILDNVGESSKEALLSANTEAVQSEEGGLRNEVPGNLSKADGVGAMTDRYTDCLLNQDDFLEPPLGVTPDFPDSFPLTQEEGLQESNQLNAAASEMIYSKDFPGMSELLGQSGEVPGLDSVEDFNDSAFARNASNPNGSENFHEQHIEQQVASQSDFVSNTTANGNEGSSAEGPSNQLHTDGQNNRGDSNNVEGEVSKKKRSSRKSKKDAAGNDTTVRKRKMKTEVAENPDKEQPPKRFSHSTRRKKRSVDQSLLEKDDDDIDYQRLPIRDLLMLADYRERQKKEPVASAVTAPETCPTPAAPTSTPKHYSMQEDDADWGGEEFDPYQDCLDDRYQEGTSVDDPSRSGAQISTISFNYHSHMNRRRIKWSKEDTELFYKGVQQFGSEFSMIAKLFSSRASPERPDRRHIKLKYKKEERLHPMRLHDALTTRAKDHAQFHRVIGNLQEEINKQEMKEAAATEEENLGDEADDDENLEEMREEIPEMAAKSEQNVEEGIASDPKTEVREVKSPDRSVVSEEEDDDDMDDFSEYKSML